MPSAGLIHPPRSPTKCLMDPRNWNRIFGWRGTVEALCSVRSERVINSSSSSSSNNNNNDKRLKINYFCRLFWLDIEVCWYLIRLRRSSKCPSYIELSWTRMPCVISSRTHAIYSPTVIYCNRNNGRDSSDTDSDDRRTSYWQCWCLVHYKKCLWRSAALLAKFNAGSWYSFMKN
jgi:hypothetical protein